MEAPPGGPVDTRKPYVAAVLPAPDAVGVGTELDARVRFSEWVAKDIERGKVYLVPPTGRPVRAKLHGDELRVTSGAPLDTGTTYVLGVLGTVKDLNGQPLEAPLELAFSTGRSLDSGRLAGTVVPFQGPPAAGAFAALYPRGSDLRGRFGYLARRGDSAGAPAPQPDPRKEKPAYIAPADSLGRFSFSHVRPGRYGLIGFQDVNGNLSPDVGGEALAIGPSVDVAAGTGDGQTLALAPYDTVPVRLAGARWVHESAAGGKTSGTVRLKFNRPPHPLAALNRGAYSLAKAGPDGKPVGQPVPVLDVCRNPLSGEIELSTLPLERDSQYVASIAGLRDLSGNAADTSRARAAFTADTASRDTSALQPIFLAPLRVSGDRPRLPPDRVMPGAGLTAYYPRLITDSLLAALRARLQAKLDTTALAVALDRVSHHELAFRFPPLPLKGQRLSLLLKADSANPQVRTGSVAPSGPGTTPAAGRGSAGTGVTGAAAPAATGTAAPAGTGATGSAPAETPAASPSPGGGPGTAAAPVRADSGAAKAPQAVQWASFTLADASKLGSLKFRQDRTAFGSRLVIRSLGSAFEVSRITPASEEVAVDSLPEGFYAVDYFRDANGDGVWNPGSLAPWAVAEPYAQWADSAEAKAGAATWGEGKRPGLRRAAPSDSAAPGAPVRLLAWPPAR